MRRVGKGRLFLVLAIWFAAAIVWVGGLYAASARCHDLLYDLPREGMGVRTPERGLCEVYDVDGTVLERHDVDEWDATEVALLLAGLGAGILVGGISFAAREPGS
jgi:hypothetical protein